MSQTSSSNKIPIELYGADWCAYCRSLQAKLDADEIEYTYYNVDDKTNEARMLKLTGGKYLIPTVVIGDRVYQNPSMAEIKEFTDVSRNRA